MMRAILICVAVLAGCHPFGSSKVSPGHLEIPNGASEPTPTPASSSPIYDATTYQDILQEQSSAYRLAISSTSSAVTCVIESVGLSATDPNYLASGSSCATISSLSQTNGSTISSTGGYSNSAFTIWPSRVQRGSYKLTFSGGVVATKYIRILENYSTTNLTAVFDPLYSYRLSDSYLSPYQPRTTAAGNNTIGDSWKSLQETLSGSLINFGSSSPWGGDGSANTALVNPYALTLVGANSDVLDLSAVTSSANAVGYEAWISPSSPTTGGKVILSNTTSGTSQGLEVMQSYNADGSVALYQGSAKNYFEEVITDSPVAYYRMNDTALATVTDFKATYNGTYTGAATLAQPAATGDGGTSVTFAAGQNMNLPIGSINATQGSITFLMKSSTPDTDFFNTHSGGWNQLTLYSSGGLVTFRLAAGVPTTDLTANAAAYNVYDGNWHHIAVTWVTGGERALFIDGVKADSQMGTVTFTPGAVFEFGYKSWGAVAYVGSFDEIAIYNTALSAARILAQVNARNKVGCRSSSVMTANQWYFLSALIDGSALKLFVNGRQECTVSAAYAASAANTFVGTGVTAGSNWSGKVGLIKVHSIATSAAPLTASDIWQDFTATANRFRQIAIKDIVSNGLVLHFDPANAQLGSKPFANGCPAASLSWFDLSSSGLNGSLTNFAGCGASTGWNGTGTTASPFRLSLDGVDDRVDFSATGLPSGNSSRSVFVWLKTTATTATRYRNIFEYGTRAANQDFLLQLCYDSDPNCGGISGRIGMSQNGNAIGGVTAVNDGVWHFVGGTYDGTNYRLYVDGNLENTKTMVTNTTLGATGTITQSTDQGVGNLAPLSGDVGSVFLYNRTLSQAEIKQLCLAESARYGGANCAAP